MTQRIYTIGETVYDIIFKIGIPQAANAGGSMLNSSVSMGRVGLPVHFISEIGKDQVGIFILKFLESNAINTDYLQLFDKGKTAIALAFLDENSDATYSFYHNYPETRLQGKFPQVDKDDIVLFGSYFAISQETRKGVLTFLKQARQAGAILIYDPNFRHPHLHEMEILRNNIEENMKLADLIRGSHEDFQLIFNSKSAEEAFLEIRKHGSANLVYSQSNKEVNFISDEVRFSIPVTAMETISTVGAGDNFNAGMIYSIYRQGMKRTDILKPKQEHWKSIIENGIRFGSHVCGSMDNYISQEYANDLN